MAAPQRKARLEPIPTPCKILIILIFIVSTIYLKSNSNRLPTALTSFILEEKQDYELKQSWKNAEALEGSGLGKKAEEEEEEQRKIESWRRREMKTLLLLFVPAQADQVEFIVTCQRGAPLPKTSFPGKNTCLRYYPTPTETKNAIGTISQNKIPEIHGQPSFTGTKLIEQTEIIYKAEIQRVEGKTLDVERLIYVQLFQYTEIHSNLPLALCKCEQESSSCKTCQVFREYYPQVDIDDVTCCSSTFFYRKQYVGGMHEKTNTGNGAIGRLRRTKGFPGTQPR